MSKKLKGVAVGSGYFSNFHYDAWNRIEAVHIAAICDVDSEKAKNSASKYNVPRVYDDVEQMIEEEKPDFLDIITPPQTHLDIIKIAAKKELNIICQKPLAPSLEDAKKIQEIVKSTGIRFMVHENFRFQPWYREIKKLLSDSKYADQVKGFYFRMRMGDGWQEDAYLNRQPYFREMEKLLIYETGVHFIDTFQFLFGPIKSVYARLDRLNPNIKGEDSGIVFFEFENICKGILDASRYNETEYNNPRYTFGNMKIDTDKGTIQLKEDGEISFKPLGKSVISHPYKHYDYGFCADCVFFTQAHFIDSLINGKSFETDIEYYLSVLKVQEAIYLSSKKHKHIFL